MGKQLRYKNFKKVHEDAHSATLQHPEGHQIKIAKGALSDHIKKQLSALPFAEGGEVDESTEPQYVNGKEVGRTPKATHRIDAYGNTADYQPEKEHHVESVPLSNENVRKTPEGPTNALRHAFGMADGGDVPEQHAAMSMPNGQEVPSNLSAEQPQQDITSQMANMQLPQQDIAQGPTNQALPQAPQAQSIPGMDQNYPAQAMQQAQSGIVGQAKAEAHLGNKEADILQHQQRSDAMLNQMHQQKQQELTGEIDNVIADVKNQKIDPNHFWNSKSNLGKASTAIGLILGGMGAGLTGGPNPALQFLNQQIDRDIEGQKMQMGQKMNMMTALQHQFGNEIDATNMAKAMQAGVYASQLQEAAAKSKDPMALARAQQANAQILAQYGPMVQQTAMRQAILGGMKQGNVEPEKAVPYLVPQEHQKEVYNEIKKAQDVNQLEKPILENFDKAAKENTILKTGFGKVRTPVSIQTLQAMALPMIHDQEGRVNEYEMKTLQDLMPQPGDTDTKIAGKRQGWINFMHQKQATPTANSFGIQVPKSSAGKFNPR